MKSYGGIIEQASSYSNLYESFDYVLRGTKKTKGITIDPNTVFDVQAKRLHEYKRQLLNVLHIIHDYLILKENPDTPMQPKTYIFAAKAASSYTFAKKVIKLINSISKKINNDGQCGMLR